MLEYMRSNETCRLMATFWTLNSVTFKSRSNQKPLELIQPWTATNRRSDESRTTASARPLTCYIVDDVTRPNMAYTEYSLIIFSHIVLAKFSITSKKYSNRRLAEETSSMHFISRSWTRMLWQKIFVAGWSLWGPLSPPDGTSWIWRWSSH
jgi:hypothetical protein